MIRQTNVGLDGTLDFDRSQDRCESYRRTSGVAGRGYDQTSCPTHYVQFRRACRAPNCCPALVPFEQLEAYVTWKIEMNVRGRSFFDHGPPHKWRFRAVSGEPGCGVDVRNTHLCGFGWDCFLRARRPRWLVS